MQNIEIKARVPELPPFEGRARVLGAAFGWTRRQRDVFFTVPRGYLKLRIMEGVPAELIAYTREPGAHARASDYVVVPVESAGGVEEALTRSLGVLGVVEKTRTLYLWRHTRIHLDEVIGLGTFLELETVVDGIPRSEAEAETRDVIRALGIDAASLESEPYLVLLRG